MDDGNDGLDGGRNPLSGRVVGRAVPEPLGGCESSAGISEQQCRESCDTGVTAKVRTGFRRYTDRGSTMINTPSILE